MARGVASRSHVENVRAVGMRTRNWDRRVTGELADFRDFPGYDLVHRGLVDLHTHRESLESLLVLVAARRLAALGIAIPSQTSTESPKDRLWQLLERQEGDGAHARYNALIDRVLSFAYTGDRLQSAAEARE